ncbi:MAG: methylglyoxal synthase [Deltaproteobacteria bacterium]|nr:methylglyoxal synthase [Deltaproteobacteria bacterium]
MDKVRKTLIAVLTSHDSVRKNNELACLFEELYNNNKKRLSEFHFFFTGGTFSRLVLGKDTEVPPRRDLKPIRKDVSNFIKSNATVLPDRKKGGVTILANLIVQRQCSIIWPFLSPITVHWLNPEHLAMMRLCDLWNAKRLMNAESVRAWFRDEAKRDIRRNPQEIPLKIALGTPEADNPWPEAELEYNKKYYKVRSPKRERHSEEFWTTQFEKQTIALIAHDAMKSRMVDFAIQYENELSKFRYILATGTTGQDVENACKKLRELNKVRRCLSGIKGGDIEIATEILFGRCHIVVFFVDPLHPHAHTDDIRVVFSACMAEIENNDVRMLTNEVQAREWIEEAVRRRSI